MGWGEGRGTGVRGEGSGVRGQEGGVALTKRVRSLSLLLDALLLVATRVEVEGEVGPLVARREGDGLAQREAHGVDDPLAARLRLAQAARRRGRAPTAAQDVWWRGEVHVLPVLQDTLPDEVLEVWRDLQSGEVLRGGGAGGHS